MAWKPNIPQATDTLSQSQLDILGNFQALNALFNNGIQPVVILPKQTVDKTTLVDQLALYSKVDAATSNLELFVRRQSNGQVIDMTGSSQTTNGWTYLPSGVLLKWGTGTLSSRNTLSSFTFPGSPAPAFNNVFAMFGIPTFPASPNQGNINMALSIGNVTNTGFQAFARAVGLPGGTPSFNFYYFAIGN